MMQYRSMLAHLLLYIRGALLPYEESRIWPSLWMQVQEQPQRSAPYFSSDVANAELKHPLMAHLSRPPVHHTREQKGAPLALPTSPPYPPKAFASAQE